MDWPAIRQTLMYATIAAPTILGTFLLVRLWTDDRSRRFVIGIHVGVFFFITLGFCIYAAMRDREGHRFVTAGQGLKFIFGLAVFLALHGLLGPVIAGLSLSSIVYSLWEHGTFRTSLLGWHEVLELAGIAGRSYEWGAAIGSVALCAVSTIRRFGHVAGGGGGGSGGGDRGELPTDVA